MMTSKWWGVGALASVVLAQQADAQVTRESDVKSVAGILTPAAPINDFSFMSQGGELLLVDLDGDLYQTEGRQGHETPHVTAEEGGGCSDEGGPGGFCLQVLDEAGVVMCWADRPQRPGWQRDPRLACPIPRGLGNRVETYILRVFPRSEGEQPCGPTGLPDAIGKAKPYLLNLSLRKIMSSGSIGAASAQSGNQIQLQAVSPGSGRGP